MPIASCLRCGNAFFARTWEGTRCPKCKATEKTEPYGVRVVTLEELAPWLREWFMSREPAKAAGATTTGNSSSHVVHTPPVVEPSAPAAASGSLDSPTRDGSRTKARAPAGLFDSRVDVRPIVLRFWNDRVDLRDAQGQRDWLLRELRTAGANPDRADLDATREKFLEDGPPDDWKGRA